jgi:hypothetical protein
MIGSGICGLRVIENINMVEYGEPYSVERTWRERLFTLPFRPLTKLKWITPVTPSQEVLRTNDSIICHPEMAKKIRDFLKAQA